MATSKPISVCIDWLKFFRAINQYFPWRFNILAQKTVKESNVEKCQDHTTVHAFDPRAQLIGSRLLQCDAPYRAHPTNFFYKLANQDIFLLVHKIQNDMFSIIRCCVTFANCKEAWPVIKLAYPDWLVKKVCWVASVGSATRHTYRDKKINRGFHLALILKLSLALSLQL